ncbi:BQ2448_6122 [Microbotryum intermedium]|uniref:BQ2448_6122 protein n=1 Tax=Microbotryum intermedium TaxID=269621 RepID=A0A238FIT2_9BASI|nr:BQ2448_6122 [Microbotryum intermedium]
MSSNLCICLIVSLSRETIHEATEWPVVPCPTHVGATFAHIHNKFYTRLGGTTGRIYVTNVYGTDGKAFTFESGNFLVNLPCWVRVDMMSCDLSQEFLSHTFRSGDSLDSDKTILRTTVLDRLVDDVQSRPGYVATLALPPMMASKIRTVPILKEWHGVHNSKRPCDVKFIFGSSSTELWETAEFLQSKSSHWADLFSSGFSESVKKLDLNGQEQVTSDVGLESATSPTTAITVTNGAKSDHPSRSQGKCTVAIHTILIEDEELYHPYRTILCWLRTGEIKFRPLVIDCHPSDERAEPEPETNPTLDVLSLETVCPKAIYRLAHSLELEELRTLALRSIVSQIKVENVALELFGQLSMDFDEVHKREFDFAIRNWSVVKKTVGMQSVQQWVKEGPLPSALQTLLDVSFALSSA